MRAGRLEALDVMRGLTIVVMIMVNTGLWGAPIAAPLRHSLWNGLTAADVVFPFFMFIMGVSISFSFARCNYAFSKATAWKVVRRTFLIYIIGVALDFVEKGISGVITGLDFSEVRLTGVLPRLAFSYGIAAMMVLLLRRRTLVRCAAVFLGVYAVVLLLFDGFEPSVENIVSRIDVAVFGEGHIYHDWVPGGRIALDPEGLAGLLPSVAHVIIGFLCGCLLKEGAGGHVDRLARLLLVGAGLTLAGFALEAGVPINKKVWSPTFVLVCCGLGALLLGVLIWAIDIRRIGFGGVKRFFVAFGVNPLALYVLSSLVGCVLWRVPAPAGGGSLPWWLYESVLLPAVGPDSTLPSLAFSLLVVGLCYVVALPLYRRRIYIKI